MLAVLVYLLKTKPNFKTIAVVNQDYAWGRESWEIFSTALKQMKPGRAGGRPSCFRSSARRTIRPRSRA